jgi:transposase
MDVSPDELDIAGRPEPTRGRVANDRAGLALCIAPRRQRQPALIVLDATGGWQHSVVAAMAMAQLPCAVVNPRHVRAVAKAPGPWAKTEALDAGGMAPFAEAVRPTPRWHLRRSGTAWRHLVMISSA